MTITESQLKQFREEGYFVTGVVFDPAILEGVLAEFHRLWGIAIQEGEKRGPKAAEMAKLRPFIGQVHQQSAVCEKFCKSEVYMEICRKLIGADADLYYNQAVLKPPGKGRSFGWHQDTQYIITNPLTYVTCWTAITRAVVDNGTIWIVPGAHRNGLLPHVWSDETFDWNCQFDSSWNIPVVLRPGQIAVFNSLLPHSSGPNISDETRAAYVVQYHIPGVRHRDKGELVGDQYPVLRGNVAV